jgi:hypothetical protein
MSELEWDAQARGGAKSSMISLDKQDDNLNPNNKKIGYLTRGLLIFTTQLGAFIIPYGLCTDAGLYTNVLIVAVLIMLSTYSITAFEPDNLHLDVQNKQLVKRELGNSWRTVLRVSMIVQYIVYGLVLIFLAAEIWSFLIFGKEKDLVPYISCMGGIVVIYIIIISANLENHMFFISRFTPLVNFLFNGYLIVLCLAYYSNNLKQSDFTSKSM